MTRPDFQISDVTSYPRVRFDWQRTFRQPAEKKAALPVLQRGHDLSAGHVDDRPALSAGERLCDISLRADRTARKVMSSSTRVRPTPCLHQRRDPRREDRTVIEGEERDGSRDFLWLAPAAQWVL